VIDLAEAVRTRGLDPFDVRVKEFFEKLRELLPMLQGYEELFLDIKAVLGLAEVIQHQGEWVKHRSSVLYLDPLLVMLKVQALEPQELAEVFMRSWSPVVELETLSVGGLREALDYWTELLPLGERACELEGKGGKAAAVSGEELKRQGYVEEGFEKRLDRIMRELKHRAGERGEISYWDFIRAESYEKTVERAWLVSFLVSYGQVGLEVDPLEDRITLKLGAGRKPTGDSRSVPIAITKEWWGGVSGRRRDGAAA
jgi:hypothetical protein